MSGLVNTASHEKELFPMQPLLGIKENIDVTMHCESVEMDINV